MTIGGKRVHVVATGTQVFNITTGKFSIWNGTQWINFCPCPDESGGSGGSGGAHAGIPTDCCPVDLTPQTLILTLYNGTGVYGNPLGCLVDGFSCQLFYKVDGVVGPSWWPALGAGNIPGGCTTDNVLGINYFACTNITGSIKWRLYTGGNYSLNNADATSVKCGSPFDAAGSGTSPGPLPGTLQWQVTE